MLEIIDISNQNKVTNIDAKMLCCTYYDYKNTEKISLVFFYVLDCRSENKPLEFESPKLLWSFVGLYAFGIMPNSIK